MTAYGTAKRKIAGRRTRATIAPRTASPISTDPKPEYTYIHSAGDVREKFLS